MNARTLAARVAISLPNAACSSRPFFRNINGFPPVPPSSTSCPASNPHSVQPPPRTSDKRLAGRPFDIRSERLPRRGRFIGHNACIISNARLFVISPLFCVFSICGRKMCNATCKASPNEALQNDVSVGGTFCLLTSIFGIAFLSILAVLIKQDYK